MAEKIKRERKPNFSDTETRFLLEGVMSEKDIIHSKLQSTVTLRMKKEAWAKIAAGVNSRSSSVVRTEDDCKKKWKDMKSAMLKEKVEKKRTGGGGPIKSPVWMYGDMIGAIMGESSAVDGIEGML